MAYFVIPFFFGVVTGIVGRMKGGSFAIWFLVGFILPAIGLIAALFSRNEKHDPRRECPSCGNLLPIAAQVCSRCGEDLSYPEELVVPAAYGVSGNGDAPE
ncbi:MAG: hypothetical protein JJE27_02495 [Thermoleophilia bacterium]|nr:hypothetical protein [Thermoleophilia bacterium]